MAETGMIAGAHPQAPGGMSRKALLDELITVHGWTRTQAKPLSPMGKWSDLIDAVCQERLAREAEQEPVEATCPTTGAACIKFAVCSEEGCIQDTDDVPDDEHNMVAHSEASVGTVIEADADFDDLLAEFEDEAKSNVMLNDLTLAEAQGQKTEMTEAGRYPEGDGDLRCDLHEVENCAECNGTAKAHDESLTDQAAMFSDAPAADTDADLDPEALMAELQSIRDADADHLIQHGLLIKDPHTNDYIFDGHAGAGPSGSERWMHCTASLGASREFLETLTPNQQETFARSGEAARQGTTAHAAAEVEARVILGEMTQEEADLTMVELSIMPESDGEAYDSEMAEYITEYVDLVRSYVQERGNENVLIEGRVTASVPLTGFHEEEVYEINGSGDCIVLPTPEDPTLVVADLKYGNGVWVGVDENSQARIYALGALGLLVDEDGVLSVKIEDVTYHIVQPRMDGIKTWSEPLADLLTWRDEVLAPALTKALYGKAAGATFEPAEGACQFCPARGGCAALAEQRVISAASLFDTIVESEYEEGPGTFPETASLTDTRLSELLRQVSGLIDIHKDLKAEAERRLYRGDSIPGYQLVNYSPPRKWKEGADQALSPEDYPDLWLSKMVTPTAAEKLLKDAYTSIENLVDKPDKRPVVAPEGDRRKTWEGRPPEAMFEDESGDEA